MQIFLPYKDVYKTAETLDRRRLNKQIIECKQILSAIYGLTKAWRTHPVTKMYEHETEFLTSYCKVLTNYRENNFDEAKKINESIVFPDFITDEYCDNFKSRLYTKDKEFYKCFESHGESYKNMYFVDMEWKIYRQRT